MKFLWETAKHKVFFCLSHPARSAVQRFSWAPVSLKGSILAAQMHLIRIHDLWDSVITRRLFTPLESHPDSNEYSNKARLDKPEARTAEINPGNIRNMALSKSETGQIAIEWVEQVLESEVAWAFL